jgi:hypothetical protein
MTDTITPDDRELLLKEADWIREDIADTWQLVRQLQAANIIVIAGIWGWILGKAIEPALSVNSDAALWALRNRGEIALAVSIVSWINLAFTLHTVHEIAHWIALNVELIRRGDRLGGETRWNWRFEIERVPYVGASRRTLTVGLMTLGNSAQIFGLWFVYPAAKNSRFVLVVWLLALLLYVITFVVIGRFARGIALGIENHLEGKHKS